MQASSAGAWSRTRSEPPKKHANTTDPLLHVLADCALYSKHVVALPAQGKQARAKILQLDAPFWPLVLRRQSSYTAFRSSSRSFQGSCHIRLPHGGETVVLRKARTLTLIVDVIVPLDAYCGICAACVCLLEVYEADDREKQEGGLLRGKHDRSVRLSTK